jgi:hypothetical protein
MPGGTPDCRFGGSGWCLGLEFPEFNKQELRLKKSLVGFYLIAGK